LPLAKEKEFELFIELLFDLLFTVDLSFCILIFAF